MSNYNNKLSFHRFDINSESKESLVNSIVNIIETIDNDFIEISNEVANEIVSTNENIGDIIDCVLTYENDDIQMICVSSTCLEYSYDIITISETEHVLILAMII